MITYIVSTYLGQRRSKLHNKCWNVDIYFLVRKQLEQLSKLQLPDISKVVFIVNNYNHVVDRGIEKVISEYQLPMSVEVLYRPNTGLSYGAWNDAMIKNISTDSKYFYLTEDDYVPVANKFYKLFIDQIEENTGYVGQLVTYDKGPVHGAISNGIIPVVIAKKIYEEKKTVLDIPGKVGSGDPYKEYGIAQYQYLEYLNQAGYVAKDISQVAYLPFLESHLDPAILDTVVPFGDKTKPVIIEPVQIPKNVVTFEILSEKDVPYVNAIRNNYSKEYLHDSRNFTDTEALDWFKKTSPRFYIIRLVGTKIGYFRTSNYSPENRSICIGCDIEPAYSNQGLGYISYRVFLDYIFTELNLNKVYLEVLTTNTRAIHLYEKLGFIKEGTKREEVFKDGKFVDSEIYSILKSELPS